MLSFFCNGGECHGIIPPVITHGSGSDKAGEGGRFIMGIYHFLSDYMNVGIVIAGIVLILLLVGNHISLINHHKQIHTIMNWKNRTSSLSKKTHEVVEDDQELRATPDDIRELETAFNKSCSWHEALAQLIPLFPLFGILGTVAGLILKLSPDSGSSVLYESMNLALQSTFLGLVFAIILKFYDALGPSRTINETEIILGDYDKKVSTAAMFDKITD